MTAGPETTAGRPNIVFIIADQLRADHLGFNGNTEVRTPNLDALAADAAVFDRAFVANPTCMPNRASLLTGRWPSVHGTRCNGISLDPDSSTFVRSLAQAGYRTAAVGKLHHQNMGWDFEPEQAEQIRDTDPGLIDARTARAVGRTRETGWDQWENRARHERGFVPMPQDYYGYQEVDLVIGHGDAPGGHWVHWARERGVDPRVLGGPEASAKPPTGWDQVYTTSIPVDVHPSTYVGERAAERIKAAAASEDPFFLFVSFPDPHHPFAPPEEYAGLYDPAAMEPAQRVRAGPQRFARTHPQDDRRARNPELRRDDGLRRLRGPVPPRRRRPVRADRTHGRAGRPDPAGAGGLGPGAGHHRGLHLRPRGHVRGPRADAQALRPLRIRDPGAAGHPDPGDGRQRAAAQQRPGLDGRPGPHHAWTWPGCAGSTGSRAAACSR